MKRLFSLFLLFIFSLSNAHAGIDNDINSATQLIAELIGKIVFFKIPFFGAQLPVVVLWLVIGAVFFTFYMVFINVKSFKHAIQLVKGVWTDPNSHRI